MGDLVMYQVPYGYRTQRTDVMQLAADIRHYAFGHRMECELSEIAGRIAKHLDTGTPPRPGGSPRIIVDHTRVNLFEAACLSYQFEQDYISEISPAYNPYRFAVQIIEDGYGLAVVGDWWEVSYDSLMSEPEFEWYGYGGHENYGRNALSDAEEASRRTYWANLIGGENLNNTGVSVVLDMPNDPRINLNDHLNMVSDYQPCVEERAKTILVPAVLSRVIDRLRDAGEDFVSYRAAPLFAAARQAAQVYGEAVTGIVELTDENIVTCAYLPPAPVIDERGLVAAVEAVLKINNRLRCEEVNANPGV